jgi:cytochrome d ubiquinol oxidase subunit I
MNEPDGITLRNGQLVAVSPSHVFFNGAFWLEFVHMLLAAYIVAGFVVAAVYAAGMLRGRNDRYHRLGFLISFTVGAVATPVQFFVGDTIARQVFNREPAKFAALELLPNSGSHVPESLGGALVGGKVRFTVQIPDFASWLAGFSPRTRIAGLNQIPVAVRPPDAVVTITHLAFDIMVGIGTLLLLLAIWFAWVWWRRRALPRWRSFLWCAVLAGPLAVISLESGWVTTEVGRQPWTVVGLLLTRDAVARSGNLWLFFGGAVLIYAAVGVGGCLALRAMHRRWMTEDDDAVAVPYGPAAEVGKASA